MEATSITAIPDGLTFKRAQHFGRNSYLFNDFTWADKADEEADGENPIFLFTSEPYLTGKLADLHLVQHQVVASTFVNHLDVDLDDLEPKNYPVDAFFWREHPRVIPTMHCGGKRRKHLDEPADVFCFNCDGEDLDFDRSRLTDLLHTTLKWPFPPASVLTTRTTRKPIDISSVADLQQVAVYIKPHLQVAEQLLDEQDVAKHVADAEMESKRAHEAEVERILRQATAASQSYAQLAAIGLDKQALVQLEDAITARINTITNGELLKQLQSEAQRIQAQIDAITKTFPNIPK